MNKHLEFCRKAAADGMVLLKNENGVLPIRNDSFALFGRGQFVTIKSGSGSGDVVGVKTVSAAEGFINAGLTLSEPLFSFNKNWHFEHVEEVKDTDKFYKDFHSMNEIPVDENIVSKTAENTDTAVVILSRVAGEGNDVELEKGDYYLSEKEENMLSIARENFAKLVVCLNFGGVYDLSEILKYNPDAVLYMSQGGQQVGNALADVITGKVTPSGKLTDTWAQSYYDYPTTKDFEKDVIPYYEGVYVGYRYFDTFNVTPLYEFGFGLSYTDFEIKVKSIALNGSELWAEVKVTNKGEIAGREVVQCYLSKPDGELEQPYQDLVAFAKTKLLEPMQSETLKLKFDFCDNASYNTSKASFVLEKGDYLVRIGNSSRNTRITAKIVIEEELTVLKTVNRFKNNVKFHELSKNGVKPYEYPEEAEEKRNAKVLFFNSSAVKTKVIERAENNKPQVLKSELKDITFEDVINKKATAEDLVAQFSIEELGMIINGINYGNNSFHNGVIGNMALTVKGAAGETFELPKYKIPSNVCADGPAGIRLLSSGDDFSNIADDDIRRTLTAYPIGTCFANSWDFDLAVEYGKHIREEMADFNIDGWLAPGMNIHRNPCCGRNFEYFSEDPLISGKMATAETIGVQVKDGKSTGYYTTVKHFIANEQENLRTVCSSEVSERALREIYLRCFEISVKESQPHALMTSYNMINGKYTTVSYDLLNGVLRSEWGFKGIVMTDWGANGNLADRAYCGNDLNMPGSAEENIKLLQSGEADIASAQQCAVRLIEFLIKTTVTRRQKTRTCV